MILSYRPLQKMETGHMILTDFSHDDHFPVLAFNGEGPGWIPREIFSSSYDWFDLFWPMFWIT
jgi:hypothetical protein